MMRDQRRLAAIVSADVAGYSRLMGRDDSDTLARLKAHRRELIDPKIAEYGGRIVKTTGDGLLLEFPSVVDAVRCAVDVQRGMAERNATVLPEQRIQFRIGINVGDIIIDGDDIFGDGVNVAARVQTLAEPGGICTSKVVRDQVLDKLSFTFENLGAQQVKNIARPVEVYRVDLASEALQTPGSGRRRWRRLTRTFAGRWLAVGVVAIGIAGVAAWALPQFWKTAPTLTAPPFSIAILPFSAPSGIPADVQLANGLTQDLTTALGRWRIARVASRGVVEAYKGTPLDERKIGRELNVRHLIEGEINRAGDRIAITTRSVDTTTGTQEWSDRTEIEASLVTSDPAVLLTRIATRVRGGIFGVEKRSAVLRPTTNSPLNLVLRGYAAWDAGRTTLEGVKEARKLCDEALRIDPNFVPALVCRATTLHWETYEDLSADRGRFAEEIDTLSQRAIAADDQDLSAWAERGEALVGLGRWREASAAVDKMAALDPTSLVPLTGRAWIMFATGHPAEALAAAERAIAINPPGGTVQAMYVCRGNLMLGRYDAAVPACEKAAALDDAEWHNQLLLVAAYAQHGDAEKAAVAKRELLKRQPGYTIAKDKATRFSDEPEFVRQLDEYFYPGLRKAGIPEQ